MAVPEQTPYKEYTANGVTTSFPLEFDCDNQDHLIVTVNGIEPEKGQWSLIDGAVVFSIAPASQAKIIIQRDTPLERNINYQTTNNSFRPQPVNKDFDRIWWKLQELWLQVTLLWGALNNKVSALWSALLKETQDRINGDLAIRTWVGILLNNIVDSGLVSAIAVTTVESVDDLQYLTKWEGRTIFVKSYYFGLNVGGSNRIYASSRALENDGFLCINGWVLQVENNTVTPEQAGAKIDDDTFYSDVAIQKAFDSGFVVQMSASRYYTDLPLQVHEFTRIIGAPYKQTVIKKLTNTALSLGDKTINGVVMNFDVDAVLVGVPTNNWYCHGLDINGLTLSYDIDVADKGYGFYAPLLAESSFSNFFMSNCTVGVFSVDSWMVRWEGIAINAETPFKFGASGTNWSIRGGTSNKFTNCWAVGTTGGNFGFDIYGLQYSKFDSCAVEQCGTSAAPAAGAWSIVNSDIVITSCGAEVVDAYCFVHMDNSFVTWTQGKWLFIRNNYRYVGSTLTEATTNATIRCINKSRLKFKGVKTNLEYSNGNQAFAYVGGDSRAEFDSYVYTGLIGQPQAAPASLVLTDRAVFYSNAYVKLQTPSDQFEINTLTAATDNPDFWNSTKTRYDFRNYKLGGYLSCRSVDLGNVNLNTLYQSYGNTTFIQHTEANATAANNYPENNVATIIQNYVSDDTWSGDYAAMLAFANIGSGAMGLYMKSKGWSSSFGAWYQVFTSNRNVLPAVTATYSLGSSSLTFNNVYTQNAVTVVSDARHKTEISELTEQELQCAIACSKLYRKYKLNAAVDEKGVNTARYHVGVIAQEIVQCFTDHGLDWRKYGIITYEKWDAIEAVEYQAATYDENGQELTPEVQAVEGRAAGEIYMVRYDELNCFINAGLEYRLSKIEAKLID
ncbi:tail fiber domain-containing protein [Acinetobacter ursingii]|uniref:tail fiber domain-containing protein n=1 Tax=Acinetobacter ursingii TaxID=108980 RepID=UPI00124D980F|nr:tail fiber domain-containing protein [Acinetobacter ursingii]